MELILTVNAGSSSIKFALYKRGPALRTLLSGELERIGLSDAHLHFKDDARWEAGDCSVQAPDHGRVADFLLDWLKDRVNFAALQAIGHRVVHGMHNTQPMLVTPQVLDELQQVVDLMTLQPPNEHSHGLTDRDFDSIFTTNKPIVFAYHGYPWLIHRLTYKCANHDNMHVRGYKEEGTTTTPFDMTVLNDLDRFHLAGDVIDRVERLRNSAGHVKQFLRDKLDEHKQYIVQQGDDMPEIRDWKWPY